MADFFNPGSPKFRRGVFLASVYSCVFVAAHLIMADYGTQEHIFTPIQGYVNRKVDALYGVTHEELYGKYNKDSTKANKPFISLRRVDLNKDKNSKQ
mmetsp:Transcript_7978/g.13245  ORF Transcript_7978/g.13245 Transcript_7978/m.13245 type:complete len:97 (+) Transcript_7978:228-518(+)